jgi:hypothetical protein
MTMKHVFRHIEARSAAYAREPLFVYLRDERVDPGEKLQFVPWASHFVMTFADLYHFFLIHEPPRDRFEELANIHLSEEGTHWKWFLKDLGVLGMDPTMRFTDAVKFIWSDETIETRRLAYEICKLSAGLTSLHKLVMVNAIEATGRVTLEALIPAGVANEARLGQKLVYFGDHHLDTERQHTIEDDAVRRPIEDLALDDALRAELCGIVDRVFDHFRGFTEDSFRVVQRRARFGERGATVAAAPPPS